MRFTIVYIGVTALTAAGIGCSVERGSSQTSPVGDTAPVYRIEARSDGYYPPRLEIPANETVTLEFVQSAERTCASSIVFPDSGIRHELSPDRPVRITVRLDSAGEIAYTCSMEMFDGVIAGRASQ